MSAQREQQRQRLSPIDTTVGGNDAGGGAAALSPPGTPAGGGKMCCHCRSDFKLTLKKHNCGYPDCNNVFCKKCGYVKGCGFGTACKMENAKCRCKKHKPTDAPEGGKGTLFSRMKSSRKDVHKAADQRAASPGPQPMLGRTNTDGSSSSD